MRLLTIPVLSLMLMTHLEGKSFRLSKKVLPIFYTLSIQPNLDDDTFHGEVFIQIRVRTTVKSIILHSSNLTILDLYLDQKQDNLILSHCDDELIEISYDDDRRDIGPGNHILFIKYMGSFAGDPDNEIQKGFFKAYYTDKDNGIKSLLLVTGFQPTYARRAFPCFDEPSFKARFKLTVITPNSTYIALSNMREIARFLTPNGMTFKFETTCLMSNYLLAFAVTQYTNNELIMDYQGGGNKLPIRGFSYNMSANVGLSLDTISRSIDFYTNYTEFPYPLSKIDIIEYDHFGSAIATEYWGLITTRKGLVSDNSKLVEDVKIVTTMVHEIAHFWFGNLVTNDWWDDLWLQESLAVFMSTKIEDFRENSSDVALNVRSMLNPITRPVQINTHISAIVQSLGKTEDIENHFNYVTYFNGAAVLEMLEHALGEDKLKLAIRRFVERYAYKTVTTNDFIAILNSVEPNLDLRGFIESYLYQVRFPVIFVDEDEERNEFVLTQKSWDFKEKSPEISTHGQKWTIPLSYSTNIDMRLNLVWFYKEMDELRMSKPEGVHWIKFAYKEVGLYYIVYSEKLWPKFIKYSNTIEIGLKLYVTREATLLYFMGIASCDVILKYFEYLFEGNYEETPLTDVWMFYYHSRTNFLDQEAFKILTNYLIFIAKRSNMKIQFKSTTIKNSDKTTPFKEEVENCSNWVKQNLYEYTNKTIV